MNISELSELLLSVKIPKTATTAVFVPNWENGIINGYSIYFEKNGYDKKLKKKITLEYSYESLSWIVKDSNHIAQYPRVKI